LPQLSSLLGTTATSVTTAAALGAAAALFSGLWAQHPHHHLGATSTLPIPIVVASEGAANTMTIGGRELYCLYRQVLSYFSLLLQLHNFDFFLSPPCYTSYTHLSSAPLLLYLSIMLYVQLPNSWVLSIYIYSILCTKTG
jgi:hypothetical protein